MLSPFLHSRQFAVLAYYILKRSVSVITISIIFIVNFMFQSFFSVPYQVQAYLSFFLLSVNFIRWSTGTAKWLNQ